MSELIFPLQAITHFSIDDPTISPRDFIIFIAVFGLIIGALVIINSLNKRRSPAAKSGSKGGGGGGANFGGFLSIFTLRKIARNIGMDNTQIRMLDFVFKTDGIVEPEKSISNPALLDRHFRRAYRILEHSKPEAEAQKKLAVLFSTRNMLENSPVGSITSTKQLKEEVLLTITYGKDKYEVHVQSAKGDHLIVEAPKNVLGSQVKIPHGTRLSVVFFTRSNKGFSFETRVVSLGSAHGRPALSLAHSAQLRFLSQRRFRRRQAVIDCFLYLVYVDNSEKKPRMIVEKRRISGTIADISVGGCSIKVMAPLQVGAKYKVEFTQGSANIAALGQVLRTNRVGVNTTVHMKFLRVSQKSMNIINAFVYDYANE